MDLKSNLEQEWLKVKFLTKEDALNFMEKRLKLAKKLLKDENINLEVKSVYCF